MGGGASKSPIGAPPSITLMHSRIYRTVTSRNAKKIVLVQDNLNTHKPASLYEAFPPDKARRLIERFEWHYTPKHGSWLDMAESELAVLASQCLDRRIHAHNNYTPISFWDFQSYYIEIVTEKIDLKSLFSSVCHEYNVGITECVGLE